MQHLNEVSEKTLIPVSLVFALVVAIVYISEMHSKVENLKEVQTEYYNTVRHIDERLSRIEGKLGVNLGAKTEIQTRPIKSVPSLLRPTLPTPRTPVATLPRLSFILPAERPLCSRENCPWENRNECPSGRKCPLLRMRD